MKSMTCAKCGKPCSVSPEELFNAIPCEECIEESESDAAIDAAINNRFPSVFVQFAQPEGKSKGK